MLKKLLPVYLIFLAPALCAQTIKTDVLVIGNSASGIAAAIQSARSKVKTVFVDEGMRLGGVSAGGRTVSVETNYNIPSGIWGEFRKHILEYYQKTAGYDTSHNSDLKFDPAAGQSILNHIADTVKNLTLYRQGKFDDVKKDGERWSITFTKNEKRITVKARVVIDATGERAVVKRADVHFAVNAANGLNIYRTSIASVNNMPAPLYTGMGSYARGDTTLGAYPRYPSLCIPIKAVLPENAENILTIPRELLGNEDNIEKLPVLLQLGQGMGTVAAFCAFFKTTTRHLNVRVIQGELLDFKGYLLPFADVAQQDAAWRAVQQVCATGMLRGIQHSIGGKVDFLFLPDSAVTTAEVKPVLMEIYTRAFIWFNKEKPAEKFAVGNLLSLISDYTLTDPLVLNRMINRDWKLKYKFKTDFDLNRAVTRREFAVLANKFLNPFARTVDLNGRLMN